MLKFGFDITKHVTAVHTFAPKTLGSKELKQVFDRCIGASLELDYTYKNEVAVYGCNVHAPSCNATDSSCNDTPHGCDACGIFCKSCNVARAGCIVVTAFKTLQLAPAPTKISIPNNSNLLLETFKHVCLSTSDFSIFISRKNGKINISYSFRNPDNAVAVSKLI